MDEVSVLQHLGLHPQIVKFMGSYTTSKYVSFFTMELMDSDVAREIKEANRSFHNESICVATTYSILKALEYLHARGVAHRDVKPGNILLKKLAKVEDWPCMRLPPPNESPEPLMQAGDAKAESGLTTSHVMAALGDFSAAHSVSGGDDAAFSDTRGTLHYKSPEQLMGRRGTISDNFTAVDLWGLGCTMYEMIMGARPFPGNSELQVLLNILDLMGSDIQSFPSTTKPTRLFQNMPVSAPFLDLLQQLLSLDASARPTAKTALQHPVFESLREAEAHFQSSQNSITGQTVPHIIGISLALKYASFTHVPQLRFSRISRTPLATPLPAPELRNSADAPYFTYVASQTSAEGEVAALSALMHYAQKDTILPHKEGSHNNENAGANAWNQAVREGVEIKAATHVDCAQHHSPDATMASFMSESSYLQWSEIRPMTQPCALTASQPHHPLPQSSDNLDQSTSGRAVALFGGNTGNTPSPSTSYAQQQQRQFSESSRHPSVSMYRSTVARALNISDSSIKVARTECSTSHIDFDLSPVAATQLFSADADHSTCAMPHTGIVAIPRPPLPVLQLKCGSTFTASNLRANSSFERNGNAMHGGGWSLSASTAMATRDAGENVAGDSSIFSTPRENALLRTTAYVGRMLCLSEEVDRCTQRSTGSCPSQQSCLNSLLTSPAPLSRVHEGSSPHPSPIRPHGAVTRSPSGLPVVEHSGFSSTDSGVDLGWMGLGFDVGATSSIPADASASAGTTVLPSENAEGPVQQDEVPSHMAAPILTAARSGLQLSSCGGADKMLSTSLLSESPHVRRYLPRSVTRDSAKLLLAPPPSFVVAGPTTSNTCVECSAPVQSNRDDSTSTARLLPLPIPLSVAAGSQTPSSSRALGGSHYVSPSTSLSQANTGALLHETPHTQRFPRIASAPSKCRSGSAIVTVKSASPDQARQEASDTQALRDYDINVPSSLRHHKKQQRYSVKPLLATRSPFPYRQNTAPSCHAAAAARAQRHCTPSSADPGREAPVMHSHDTRQFSVTQPHSSALPAEVCSLHFLGPVPTFLHTPSLSDTHESTCVVKVTSVRGQCCSREGICAATPRSTRRSSYKRSREGLASEGREADSG
ncbi:putative protein kinase [Leptomonas seymouri]|uniref:Protein kinase domain-containing protein n=1 Tax=Leptomonas seymouri TaxID=5684 RepID=A0A0N1HWI3_LEPSE|nr:putative protein kinase [Leptomonas seymouri]|eukprot:KPI86438.1 putative protein kinase [Leptomonas seymouri]